MKIFWLSTGLFKDKYGQQNYELSIFEAIFERFKDSAIFNLFLLNDASQHTADIQHAGVTLFLFGGLPRIISRVKLVLSFSWQMLKVRPDFVICSHVNLSALCFFICRLLGIKFAIITYGKDVWDIKNKLHLQALKNAEFIVTMSNHTAASIKQQVTISDEKIHIVPAYIDTRQFYITGKDKGLMDKYDFNKAKVLLTVCRLSLIEEKGYRKVIEVLPDIMKEIPDLRYLIVGSGDDMPYLKKLIEDKRLGKYIILSGFIRREELNSYYNLCDVFIMPSKQEGFGIVYLEALACGKPVIAGNCDGSTDALLAGKLGVLINPDDPAQIKNAVIDMFTGENSGNLADPGFLRQAVLENFSFDIFKKKIGYISDIINNCRKTAR